MAKGTASSPLSNMMTSVLDLLFLMVISLFTLGGMLSLLQRMEPSQTPQSGAALPLSELAGQAADLAEEVQQAGEMNIDRQVDPLKRQLAADQTEEEERRKQLDALTRQRTALEARIRAERPKEKDLQELNEALAGRGSELSKLEADRRRLRSERDRLLGRLTNIQMELDSKYKKGGVAWESPPPPGERYDVLLSEGVVFPLEREFFTVQRLSETSLLIWPSRKGLTLHDALAKGSPLMKKIADSSFRSNGWVCFLVNPDSFSTFRALRDAVEARGVPVAWEPFEGTRIPMSDEGGRSPAPQRRRQ